MPGYYPCAARAFRRRPSGHVGAAARAARGAAQSRPAATANSRVVPAADRRGGADAFLRGRSVPSAGTRQGDLVHLGALGADSDRAAARPPRRDRSTRTRARSSTRSSGGGSPMQTGRRRSRKSWPGMFGSPVASEPPSRPTPTTMPAAPRVPAPPPRPAPPAPTPPAGHASPTVRSTSAVLHSCSSAARPRARLDDTLPSRLTPIAATGIPLIGPGSAATTKAVDDPMRLAAVALVMLALSVAAARTHAGRSRGSRRRSVPAPEANQAAAADERFVYAIDNSQVAKYDRATGGVATSTGVAPSTSTAASSGRGRLFCATRTTRRTPELSEIKVLDVETMELPTFKDFGNYGGSLTWAVRHEGDWWCNFARTATTTPRPSSSSSTTTWKEQAPLDLSARVTRRPVGPLQPLRRLFGGAACLLVTGHDDPRPVSAAAAQGREPCSSTSTRRGSLHRPGIRPRIPTPGGLVGIHRGASRSSWLRPPRDCRPSSGPGTCPPRTPMIKQCPPLHFTPATITAAAAGRRPAARGSPSTAGVVVEVCQPVSIAARYPLAELAPPWPPPARPTRSARVRTPAAWASSHATPPPPPRRPPPLPTHAPRHPGPEGSVCHGRLAARAAPRRAPHDPLMQQRIEPRRPLDRLHPHPLSQSISVHTYHLSHPAGTAACASRPGAASSSR